jgi:uncharacterized SAM-binding protein YcdF (DUF218 family)
MIRLLATLGLLWALGFAVFAITLPAPADGETTDAVIVLTGGPGRVQRGLAVLKTGRAKRMLVSGVGRAVTPHELAVAFDITPALMARTDLGHESVDTRSNADESKAWIDKNDYRSVRLVTTNWHMARAKLELRRMTRGGLNILPDAVPSHPPIGVLIREYDKYLLRLGATLAGY